MPLEVIQRTQIWQRTLAPQSEADPGDHHRERLRNAFLRFRERVDALAAEIPEYLKHLTVHDMSHIDALWEVADLITGPDYPLNPAEAFVLGGAFLLHDVGMAMAAYPKGLDELKAKSAWRDTVARLLREVSGRAPSSADIDNPGHDIEQQAIEQTLRQLHAERAASLAQIAFEHPAGGDQYFLVEDTDLRNSYGHIMGTIAYSHWWSISRLPEHFSESIGAFPSFPPAWTVDPLKLACILRAADACHLDARRAPGFLRALRKPLGDSDLHWRFQQYILTPHGSDNRIVFSSSKPFPDTDAPAWWLAREMISLADTELRQVDSLLRDTGRPPFKVNSVAGNGPPEALSKHIETKGWIPVDTTFKMTNVVSLIRKLGGKELYGNDPTVPLRELIQNARDAIVARRLLEGRDRNWGRITVRIWQEDDADWVEVDDEGLGMSETVLTKHLLDFGSSYWDSTLIMDEHPGLLSTGFVPSGQYGIGFFSVFMWGNTLTIVTRRHTDGKAETRVMEFEDGVGSPPLLRTARPEEQRNEPGTTVRVKCSSRIRNSGGLLGPGTIGTHDPGDKVRRENGWKLAELCQWLCPAMDVDLWTEEDAEDASVAVAAHDWESMNEADLLRRLTFAKKNSDCLLLHPTFQETAERIQNITDAEGRILGRACIIPRTEIHDITRDGLPRILPLQGTLTAGQFRAAASHMNIAGLLIGAPSEATRKSAVLIARTGSELGSWATEQAKLLTKDLEVQQDIVSCAGLIRRLGGSTENLSFVRTASGMLSFKDIAGSDLPHEILLFEDQWVSGFETLREIVPYAHVFGVAFGRMANLWYDGHDGLLDPLGRSDHPQWRRYWKSLWGATVEAIAKAWDVSLDAVLHASEFVSSNEQAIREVGMQHGKPVELDTDVIRHPKQ